MKKLTRSEIAELQENDQTVYRIRLTRLYPPRLIFEGSSQLYIQRAPKYKNLPERLAIVTPKEKNWAEGSIDDVTEDGSIIVEDYMMEIYH